MTNRNQLLATAGALACALLLSGAVEAQGGAHAVGAELGLHLRAQLFVVAGVCLALTSQ